MEQLDPQLVNAAENAPQDDVVTETTWQGRRLVIAHNAEREVEQSAWRRPTIEELDTLGTQVS